MELDQIEAFVAIVRGGGFTRAASILNLSQPAVSRRLDLLERALGAPLFERMRSGAILTEAGQTFLPHAEGLLASMRDGIDAVRALQEVDRGDHRPGPGGNPGQHHADRLPAALSRRAPAGAGAAADRASAGR